jgi:hypothetical protein
MPTALLQSRTRRRIPSSTSSSANRGSSSKLVGHLATARTVKRSTVESRLVRIRRIIIITPILPPLHLFCHYSLLLLCRSDLLSRISRVITPLLLRTRANSCVFSRLWISFQKWVFLRTSSASVQLRKSLMPHIMASSIAMSLSKAPCLASPNVPM